MQYSREGKQNYCTLGLSLYIQLTGGIGKPLYSTEYIGIFQGLNRIGIQLVRSSVSDNIQAKDLKIYSTKSVFVVSG